VEESTEESKIFGTPIIIYDQPLVFWESAPYEYQRVFLETVDSSYFTYHSQVHAGELDGKNARQAAVALRATYSQCLETLFALIGAAIQAPWCPAGWILRYKNKQVEHLIADINSQHPVINAHGYACCTWDAVSNIIYPWPVEGIDRSQLIAASTMAMRSFAKDFIDPIYQEEYNSLKHGLRARSSPWFLSFGLEDTPGVPAAPERMRTVATSSYGTSYLRPENIKPHQWRLETQRSNWTPHDFALRIPLAVQLIENTITYLKIENGFDPKELQIRGLTEGQVSTQLSRRAHSDSVRWSIGPNIGAEMLDDISRDEILLHYREFAKRNQDIE
jgi:hypothetical protein